MLEERLLVQYPVQIKTNGEVIEESRVSVNWCYFDMPWQVKRRDKLLALLDSAPEIAKNKVMATLKFHDQMVSREFASLTQIGGGRVFGDPTGGTA